ncbi:hypothetical protein ACLJYM_06430 [Rhizobium giardinii]|uniref:hypothetical protein n=1 Tax=Rhizobium giardinii TaxID=56731 RepID=UPI0039DFBF77
MGWLSDVFGGGSSKTTTQATSEPWKAAQKPLKLGLNEAEKLFKADKNGSYYTGSTVVPWDSRTQQGMGLISGQAHANSGGKGLSAQYQDIINQGGYTDDQKIAADRMQNMATGNGLNLVQERAVRGLQDTINANGYNPQMRGAHKGFRALARDPFNSFQDNALQNTQATANSRFDINSNPAFQDVLRQAQGAARDSVNMSAGGAGRYGGGVHQGNLASEVGDLTSRMVGGEYNNWQNRRDTANSNLFNMGQTGIGTQMNAQGQIANLAQSAMGNLANAQNNMFGMGQTGQTNRMNAQNSLYGMGQQGLANLNTAYTGMQQPANDLMKVGAMNEDLATRQMNDKLRLFNDKQNAPWDQIGRLNAIASGAGQMGGTQTQSAPGTNPFLSALGYASGGAGLLGSFL